MSETIVGVLARRANTRFLEGDHSDGCSHPKQTLRLLCYEELVGMFPWIKRVHAGAPFPMADLIVAELWHEGLRPELPPRDGTTKFSFVLAGRMADLLSLLLQEEELQAA